MREPLVLQDAGGESELPFGYRIKSCSVTEVRDLGKTISKKGKMDINLRRKTEDVKGEIAPYFSHSLYKQSIPLQSLYRSSLKHWETLF